MFLKQIDLTTALRPSYLPDEVLLFVQDNVGLYEGSVSLPAHVHSSTDHKQTEEADKCFYPSKYKLPDQQNGQVYLTSHRICYVDKADPRKQSVALDLKDVERYEFYVRTAQPCYTCRLHAEIRNHRQDF